MTGPGAPTPPASIEVFYSYAHEDEELVKQLRKHLSTLKRQGVIRDWYDREITAGTDWKGQIDQHLNSAGVILLLVSADFLASDYRYDVEVTRALERHDQGEARVIPVILRPVDWKGAPFGKLQSLPTDGKPVTSWQIRDEAFADVARGIRRAVSELAVLQPKSSSWPASQPTVLPAPSLQRIPAVDRSKLVRTLASFNPADFALLITAIPGAAAHVGRYGTVPEQAADLIRWAESPTGPGLAAIETALATFGNRDDRHPPPGQYPFFVPFPRNHDFVGRDDDLARLHAIIAGPGQGPVGIRPAGLTGMGGIGKTQLAVEYVYQHKGDFPDGIFWIDATGPLAEGFARLATDSRLRWAESNRPRDEQIRAAYVELNRRPNALLVLDNLPEPAALAVPVVPDCVPEDLQCRLLFTTRRRDLGRFAGVEVTVLPEDAALRLLLRHPSRRAALDPPHPNHEHARAIARMLGRLPLALELAGAYLGKFSRDVSLVDYREGLKSDGALAILDADAAELTEADLRRVHAPAVAATIGEQWNALRDDSARLLLRVTALFPESAAVPISRLGVLAGLGDEARSGRLSPLRRAVKRLEDACLGERLEADQVRLHPLIREFAVGQTPPDDVEHFPRQCLERGAAALEHFPILERIYGQRGVDALQEDLIAILGLCPASAPSLGARLQALLRLLQREAHLLRGVDPATRPLLFAQQVRNRAFLLGITALQSGAESRLAALRKPHALLLCRASRESAALVRSLAGHWQVDSVAVTADGRLALAAARGEVKVWDLTTGQELRTLRGHSEWVNSVAVSADGRLALSGSRDGKVKVWDLTSGQELRPLAGHAGEVNSVAVSADGRLALSGSRDGKVKVWDLTSGQELRPLAGHAGEVNSVAVSADGRLALSGSEDGTVKVWDLTSGQEVRPLAGHAGEVNSVAVSADGRLALSGSRETVKVWDLTSGRELRPLAGHADLVSSVAVSADGRLALSGSRDGAVKVWDLTSGQELRPLAGHSEWVNSVAVSADGRLALSGSRDETVRVWDLTSGQELRPLAGHAGEVNSVAVSADGRLALSGSRDETVKVWDVQTGQELRSLAAHWQVFSVAVSADGRLALAAARGKVKVWDLTSGQELRTLAGHADLVSSVAVSADGRLALSGSHDCTVKVWDLETGQCLATLPFEDPLQSLALAPDGATVVVGDAAGGVTCLRLVLP